MPEEAVLILHASGVEKLQAAAFSSNTLIAYRRGCRLGWTGRRPPAAGFGDRFRMTAPRHPAPP